MIPENARLFALIFGFTVASGVLDSFAFTYSASVWQDGKLAWAQVSKAGVSFALGISMYFIAIRFLGEAGIVLPEIQTLIWFTVTILGVSLIGGRFIHWPAIDQVVAANVFVSLGWLVTRVSE